MVIKDIKLVNQLEILRTDLQQKYLDHGEKKLICTDDAIKEMVHLKPLRMSDFLAVAGLDYDFMENHSHLFLEIIRKYMEKYTKSVKVSKEASKVLDRYKDRLTNISRTNPNLYTGKLTGIKHFDLCLYPYMDQVKDFVLGNQSKIKIDGSERIRKALTILYREVNKSYQETGSYDLYIAYPYVSGVYKKDFFTLKAPLAYMPVTLTRDKKIITLVKDKNKDIVLNRDLLLTLAKMNKHKELEAFPEINDLKIKTIRDIIIPFYQKYGFVIKGNLNFDFIPFENELKENFIKQKKDVFYLKPYVTLGRFQLFSSNLQKDIAEILSTQKYNELLEGLIDDTDLFDVQKPISIDVQDSGVNEADITYINDINHAQEKIIEMVDKYEKVVIWGPPGTGKSQTITNLVAHQVLKGQNVLVISEKKVALDVIYSRLGESSKYALFIDDASNKTKFYEQLNKFIDQTPPQRNHNNDIYKLEEKINYLTKQFDYALNLMYQDKNEDKHIYQLYSRYIKDKDLKEELTPKKVYKLFNHYLSQHKFLDIEYLESVFDKNQKLADYIDFKKIVTKYKWFTKLETKITRSSIIELNEVITSAQLLHQRLNKSWFLKKRRLKNEFIEKYSMSLSFLTKKISIDKKLLKALCEDSDFTSTLEQQAKKLNKIKQNYIKLDSRSHQLLDMFIKENISYKNRNYVFDAFYTGFIEYFKTSNQKQLYMIDTYDRKIEELKTFMKEKQEMTRESFEMKLYQYALEFSNTKRIMDIKRILESSHLPSIQAFFDIFHVELFSNVRVWLMTPEAVSTIVPLKQDMFDLVIFDEASQMYVEKAIPAIYRAKKVVIAGDPKQLRPSSLGFGRIEESDEFYEDEILKNVTYDAKSLLDLARYKYHEGLLNYHYRSQFQELIEFSNHAFYDGKLIISPNVLNPKIPPISYVYVKDGVFKDRHNVAEAKAIVELLKKVLKNKEKQDSIGIITFSSTQRDLITNEIDEVLFTKSVHQKRLETEMFRYQNQENQSLFVKNIENVQGDERDIIIFSMGYAKDDLGVVKRRFGWLNHEGGQNRLNVAITRAKKKIYFVSSLYPEELKVDDLSGRGPKLLKDFMRYCFYVSNKNMQLTQTILNQLYHKESETKKVVQTHFVNEIKQKLEKLGYVCELNIGIGQFRLDLAIYDKETERYKLGIICDLSTQDKTSARKELLHQEKFLNARGWQVMRVFSMQWYEDSKQIIKEIKSRL